MFSHDFAVSADDVDELGHVNNLVYVRWVLDVATAHSRAVGWDFTAYRSTGGVFVVRRQEIDYLRPAFAGERVRVDTWVEGLTRVTSMRRTRILRGDDELARAATIWAFVSMNGGRPQRIPEQIRAAFSVAERGDP